MVKVRQEGHEVESSRLTNCRQDVGVTKKGSVQAKGMLGQRAPQHDKKARLRGPRRFLQGVSLLAVCFGWLGVSRGQAG